ncbi:MAG: phospholipid carrier-dependent glycosyltransferase, partial [Thermoanaerobaculia bacterium]|nr:phospholipid carrier-dependent glycosyltransferase [Thermoanaerobaculia bacterium]
VVMNAALTGRKLETEQALVREEVERIAQAELDNMERGLAILSLVATISPLLGLLGTVTGLVEAFQNLQAAGDRVDPAILSGGIWEALLTTVMGLSVAIPASVLYLWLQRTVEITASVGESLTLQQAIASALNAAAQIPMPPGYRLYEAGGLETLKQGQDMSRILLGLALFLPGLGSRDLWNPDEPRYAEVAREMMESGQYLVPHLNGEIYREKPPLRFWSICLAALATGGLDEAAVRLPAALEATFTLVLVYLLGLRLFDRRTALLSAAIFVSTLKILWQGRIGQIDMQLIALVTLAMYFFVRGRLEQRPIFYRLFFVATGVATIAKGPAGFLPPLFAVIAFLLFHKERDELRRFRPVLGLGIWVLTVLCWLGPATIAGGREYLEHLLVDQNVRRFADPWHHFQPWYYYLKVLPADFFPWALLLPAALIPAWRGLEGKKREGMLFCLAWVVVTLVFFSLSPAKRTVYILTMYPGLALIVGHGMHRLAESWPRGRGWIVWPLGALAVIFTTAAALLPRFAQKQAEDLAVVGHDLVGRLIAIVLVMAIGFGVGAWLARRGRIAHAVGTVAGAMSVAVLTVVLFVLPRFDRVKSARPLSEILLSHLEPGESFGLFPRIEPPFLFYTERFAEILADEAELRAYLAEPGERWVIAERRVLEKIEGELPAVEIARDQNRREGYVLLRGAREEGDAPE